MAMIQTITMCTFFFLGKTFKEIGEQFGKFDFAAIPIGAFKPRDVMRDQHVEPKESVKIHKVGKSMAFPCCRSNDLSKRLSLFINRPINPRACNYDNC